VEISSIPSDRQNIKIFRTKANRLVAVTVFLFLLAVLVYSQGLYTNIPVLLSVSIALALFVVLVNHYKVGIAPEGLYIEKFTGLLTKKALFFPEEQIKTVSVILSLNTHYVVVTTLSESEKIPASSLADTDGFMELIKKRYSNVLKEHLDTSKFA